MKRLAVIPARGGSKRIPQKNIKSFNGKPIIHYSIQAALTSGVFDRVVVSTDDQDIADIALSCGADVPFLRPTELSGDWVGVFPVLEHTYNHYYSRGEEFDQVWLVSACAPLLQPAHLVEAASTFDSGTSNALLAVGEFPAPAEWAFSMTDNAFLQPKSPGAFSTRSQDLDPSFFDTGTFSAFTAARIRGETSDSGDLGFSGFVLSKEFCVDIDTMQDWYFAESLYQALQRNR